ncbi:MAG TPA: sigma factor [Thermoanaerobaculia bacterium]|nr:sigma factor [Thermoanaerobaculia bacterium]
MRNRHSTLLALNDPRLARYLTAEDEAARGRELERILLHEVQPRVRSVLGAFAHGERPIDVEDADDIVGVVTLRLLRKLRAATVLEEESLQSVEAYVTTLTKNSVRDFLRRRSPERARIKARLRHLFLQDPRLALWNAEGLTLCGLAGWSGRFDHETNRETMRDAIDSLDVPPEAFIAGLLAIGKPVRLGNLAAALAGDLDVAPAAADEPRAPQRDLLEARQYLQVLWREIRDLPPRQRAALLLNLREPGSGNAVTLFVAVGIATLDEIAVAMEMSRAELRAIWNDLPFDDLRIATHLGVTRQQVINLRKSARERLARRMAGASRGRGNA